MTGAVVLRAWRAVALLGLILCLARLSSGAETQYIYGTGADGVTRELELDRYPSLYTGDFADCLGGQSLFNITKFDAAYYADNMTVLFHLDGTTNVRNESLMSAYPLGVCRPPFCSADATPSGHHHGSL